MKEKRTLGVVVGRFQSPFLHEGHRHIIDKAIEECEVVLVLIGSCIVRSKKNPLDFNTRMHMVMDAYPNVRVKEIKDKKDDIAWATNLQKIVRQNLDMEGFTMSKLYGSRDSFLDYYAKEYSFCFDRDNIEVVKIEGIPDKSSTAIRENLAVRRSEDYRVGYIKAVNDTFPASTAVVDAIVYGFKAGRSELMVLVGQKHYNKGTYYIPGGFVDSDETLEVAALRELREETGLDLYHHRVEYLCSKVLNKDWRYLNSNIKPITTVFSILVGDISKTQERIRSGDDLHSVEFKPFSEIRDKLVPFHKEFIDYLIMRKTTK